MGYNLEEFILGERCTVKSSKRIFAREYVDDGIPFFRSKDVIDKSFGTFSHYDLFISRDRYLEIKKQTGSPQKGDVLISSVGNRSGQPYVVQDEGDFYFKDGNILWLSEFKNIDADFLSYWFKSRLGQQTLENVMIGSAQKALTIDAIRKLVVRFPEYPEQVSISHILKTLDDKIELNRQMNATLEAMAQALFKSWFVDFDPVIDKALAVGNEIPEPLQKRARARQALGEKHKPLPEDIARHFPSRFVFTEEMGWVPEGWEVYKIGDELKTVLGGTPARKNAIFWTNGTVPWINSGKVNEFRIIQPSEYITRDAVKKSATELLPKRTTLIAITGATLGQVSINEIECCANQSVVGIIGNEKLPNEYIYFWIKSIIRDIIAAQTGGAQQHINKGNINDTNLLIPHEGALNNYIKLVSTKFDSIALNCFKSLSLINLRDTLLPKLISGRLPIIGFENNVKE